MNNNFAIFDTYNFIPEGIFIIDHNFSIVFWNKALEDISNIKSEQILEKNLLEIFPRLNKNIYKLRLENIFKGGAPEIFSAQIHKYIIPCKLSSGNFRAQHTVVTSIPSENRNLSYAVFTIKDVTDEIKRINDYGVIYKKALHEIEQRKIAEQSLKESEEELKQLNTSKDKFFSIIAHDLRNPIGGIRNLLEMMKIYRSNMSDDEFSKIIETSYNASTSTYELLENLLEWANIQKGKIKYEPMINSLHESVELAIKHAHIIAHNKEIAIKNEVADSVYAYYDKGLLSIVLRNLITNSVKYSYKESEIKIWQKNNSEDSDQDNHKDIVLAVSDNGIGMHEETIDNIFKIDQVKSKPGTQNEKGSGLGLILCKEFIEINNGKIWVESEIKKGSTFYFSLPKEN